MENNSEKIKIETREVKESGDEKIREGGPEEEIGGEKISEEEIKKQEAEIEAKDEEKLSEERKKIKEMPGEKEEKTIEERTIEKLSEEHPNVPEDLLKNYIEATKKLAKMNIPTKLREKKDLTSIEKLALQDWKNIKATMDLLERSK